MCKAASGCQATDKTHVRLPSSHPAALKPFAACKMHENQEASEATMAVQAACS